MSSDGSIVAIGAPGNDDNGPASGHVKVYEFESDSKSSSLSTGAIVGICVGAVVLVSAVFAAVVLCGNKQGRGPYTELQDTARNSD